MVGFLTGKQYLGDNNLILVNRIPANASLEDLRSALDDILEGKFINITGPEYAEILKQLDDFSKDIRYLEQVGDFPEIGPNLNKLKRLSHLITPEIFFADKGIADEISAQIRGGARYERNDPVVTQEFFEDYSGEGLINEWKTVGIVKIL